MTALEVGRLPEAGSTVVVAQGKWGWNLHGETYALGEVKRVTAKRVYTTGKLHHRDFHDRRLCFVVPDQEAGHRLIEELVSAKTEMDERISRARIAYQNKIAALLPGGDQP